MATAYTITIDVAFDELQLGENGSYLNGHAEVALNVQSGVIHECGAGDDLDDVTALAIVSGALRIERKDFAKHFRAEDIKGLEEEAAELFQMGEAA
jgi:hypothetical protein